jgi:hypothetical protein
MYEAHPQRSHAMHNFSTSTRIVQVAKITADSSHFLNIFFLLRRTCTDFVQSCLRKTQTISQCFLSGR